jgi:hypothetical protein
MAQLPVVEQNTPEKIALDLLRMLAHMERRALHADPPDGWQAADREWLLRTFAECLVAVRGEAGQGSARRRPGPLASLGLGAGSAPG